MPEGEASAGSEPAPGTVPPLTAAGTADAAREPPARTDPVSPTNPANPGSRHSAAKPGLLSPLLVTGEPVAAVVPPGVMAGRLSAKACNRIANARLACFAGLSTTAAPL